jgi:hypothetical protein
MIPRIRCVSIALLALLAAAPACLADDVFGVTPGKGGIGGGLGGGWVISEKDYSSGAQPRFSFAGQLRYVASHHWRWQVSPGFTWAAYSVGSKAPFRDPQFPADSTKDQYLTSVVPISAQIQFLKASRSWLYHLGVGPGLYRVWIQNRRKVLRDPVTNDLHRGLYPGLTVELGGEDFLKTLTTTSIEATATYHLVFAERNDQFPSGFNSKLSAVELRLGINYYFDLTHPKSNQPAGVPAK